VTDKKVIRVKCCQINSISELANYYLIISQKKIIFVDKVLNEEEQGRFLI